MRSFPDTKFIVWTGAALTEATTTPDEAQRTREFFDWVKAEWDEPGDNIFLWDFYELETEGGPYLKPEYASAPDNPHPTPEFGAEGRPLVRAEDRRRHQREGRFDFADGRGRLAGAKRHRRPRQMCGIVGVCDLGGARPVEEATLRSMLGTIRHRGPDQFGIYLDDHVGLGNARLSIIDLSTGQQPISNEDGSLWIVFNGEVFNHPELRLELERRGHRFSTTCDTEVVLHAYEEYGPDCLSRFNGQFAIAIWDSRDRSLFLARDRLGVRPLFYTEADGALVFGSEIKAILAASRRHRVPGSGGAGPDLHVLEHALAADVLPGDQGAAPRPLHARQGWPDHARALLGDGLSRGRRRAPAIQRRSTRRSCGTCSSTPRGSGCGRTSPSAPT